MFSSIYSRFTLTFYPDFPAEMQVLSNVTWIWRVMVFPGGRNWHGVVSALLQCPACRKVPQLTAWQAEKTDGQILSCPILGVNESWDVARVGEHLEK